MESGKYELGSVQERLASLVWHQERLITAKKTLALIIAPHSPEKAIEKYKEICEEMYPAIKEMREEMHRQAQQELDQMRGQEWTISTVLDDVDDGILDLYNFRRTDTIVGR